MAWHSVDSEARRAEAKLWVWIICGATVASSILHRPKLSCHRVFQKDQHVTLPSIDRLRDFLLHGTVLPPCTVPIPCIIAEKALKMAHFSKTGSRNMVETCAIDFSYPTSYSTSVPIEGLSARLLPFLM